MNVLIVDRPGAFRDALVNAVRARGAAVSASDGALDALGKLRELAPRRVVVSDTSGPPDVASTARMMRRQLGDVLVYHLHDPSAGASAADTRPLSRLDHVDALARELVEDSVAAAPAVAVVPQLRAEREEEAIEELLELASEHPPAVPAAIRPAPPAPPAPPAAPIAAPPAPPIAAPAATPEPEPVPEAVAAPATRSDADTALLAEVEPLVHQSRWQEVIDLVGKREPDPQRLSPRAALLYAVALKEAPSAGPGLRPTVDPDLLGVRAVAALLQVDGQSRTALMIAKRVLRRRPLEWQRTPPRRVSLVITLIALALGAAAGLIFKSYLIPLWYYH